MYLINVKPNVHKQWVIKLSYKCTFFKQQGIETKNEH